MRKPISATDRCTLFKAIAANVWDRTKCAHEVDINIPEIGITADVLIDILQFSKNNISNFDVFARHSWNENTYGSDIDIFVETTLDNFRWFALQAKVLKKNNRYDTLRDSSDGVMQWDKLKLLEGVSGCKAYYLLYNGMRQFSFNDTDECNENFDERQFGCSLADVGVIENLANTTSANGRFIRPKFEDIHPHNAQPWRILTCCYHDTQKYKLYKLNEILGSNPELKRLRFEKIESDQPSDGDAKNDKPNDGVSEKDIKINDAEITIVEGNKINQAMLESKWNPSIRIIIKRTDNLIENGGESGLHDV